MKKEERNKPEVLSGWTAVRPNLKGRTGTKRTGAGLLGESVHGSGSGECESGLGTEPPPRAGVLCSKLLKGAGPACFSSQDTPLTHGSPTATLGS